ncbi:hypothetical protein ABTY59_32130 [Streptomyces sp. NPDC096079]|uniref:hypothetical protein n=1 Tax=Streptomyces sp. NPDC096079 TaxID=3155820 RepID=UPI00331DC8EE
MTQRSMPPRTMLPPNLNRHLYEVQRRAAQEEGREMPPWWRLNAEQRAAIENALNLFREAIRASEEEQDLVGSYNASAPSTPPAPEPPAAETSTTGPCTCPGCSTAAAITQALRTAFASSGMTVSEPPPGGFSPLSVRVVPLDARRWGIPLSEEEKARLEAVANGVLGPTLIAASIDPAILEGRAPRGPRVDRVEFGPTEASQGQGAPPAVTRQDVLNWFNDVLEDGERQEPVLSFDLQPIRLEGSLTTEVENFRANPRLFGFPHGRV